MKKAISYILVAIVVWFLVIILSQIFVKIFHEPKTKYDCLKLGSDPARAACLELYFPKNKE